MIPTVSVITITRDDPGGLRRTLDSVRRQSHPTIEHIVIDGGSGPDVVALLGEHTHLAHWQSCPDGGRYDAMNIGFARSTGELVWFLHSGDTFASPDAVSTAAASFDDSGAGWWAYGRAQVVDAGGNARGFLGGSEFSLDRFILGGHPIPHQAAVFHRSVFETIGIHSLVHGLAADQEFMLRAARLRPPDVLDAVLCDFDDSGAGSTRGVHPHFADMRRAVLAHVPMSSPERLVYLMRSNAVEARAHLVHTRHRMRRRGRLT